MHTSSNPTSSTSIRVDNQLAWSSGLMDFFAAKFSIDPAALIQSKQILVQATGPLSSLETALTVRLDSGREFRGFNLTVGELSPDHRQVLRELCGIKFAESAAPEQKPEKLKLKRTDLELPGGLSVKYSATPDDSLLALTTPKDLAQIHTVCMANGAERWRAVVVSTKNLPPVLETILSDIGALSWLQKYTDHIVFTPRLLSKSKSIFDSDPSTPLKDWRAVGGLAPAEFSLFGTLFKTQSSLRIFFCSLTPQSELGQRPYSEFGIVGTIIHENAHMNVSNRVSSGDLSPDELLVIERNEYIAYSKQAKATEKLLRLMESKGLKGLDAYDEVKRDNENANRVTLELARRIGRKQH